MQCTLRWASSSSRHQHVFAHLQCGEGHVLYSCLVGFHFRGLDVVPWESAARQDLLLACRTGATLCEFQTCHWTRYQPLVFCVSPRPEAQKARTCCSHCPLCWPLVVLEDHSLLAGSSPAPCDGLPLLCFVKKEMTFGCVPEAISAEVWSSSSAHLFKIAVISSMRTNVFVFVMLASI